MPTNTQLLMVAVAGLYLARRAYIYHRKSQRRKRWPKDAVVLHQLPRGKFTPSVSPFPLKLETYLRMSGIRYENDFEETHSSKGKTPWITINGIDIADSQLCLEMLADTFQIDFSSHLSPQQKATARALQIMAEDHLYWVGLLWRWVYRRTSRQVQLNFAKVFRIWMIHRKMKDQALKQGMGRHSQNEVVEMGMKDLRCFSRYLGNKPFFMGDEPTELDCAMFGMLAHCVWNLPDSPFEWPLDSEFLNLKWFCERMRDRFWPDWDQCLSSVQR